MNIYSWPANVIIMEKGVVLAFPEWPDLAPVGDSVHEAMLTATDALCAAVAARIETSGVIPAPSDLGPRQIPIAIDAETAARVDAYLEEREARNLRQRNEFEQVMRERRGAFLTEFRANLEPIERIIDRVDAGATEFAQIGVRSCYFLNAGGLVAIPAILQVLGANQLQVSGANQAANALLVWPASIFALGIFLSAITNYLAYRSMFVASEGWGHENAARAKEATGIYYPPEDQAAHKAQIAQHRVDNERELKSANRYADKGVATFGGAVFCFLVGVGLTIYRLV